MNAVMHTPYLRIADWTLSPGFRHRWQAEGSAEEYVESVVRTQIQGAHELNQRVVIDLDGTHTYFISFIDELFGAIAEMYGVEWALAHVVIKSAERPWLIAEAQAVMQSRLLK